MVDDAMGLLSEAIRSHLELKRQHGADPHHVAHLEQEVFGPVEPGSAGKPDVDIAGGISIRDQRGHGDVGQETVEIDVQGMLDQEEPASHSHHDAIAFDWAHDDDWTAGAVDKSFHVEWETPVRVRHAI